METKRGISLLVLAITITIIIILTGIVFMNLEPLSERLTDAQRAKLEEDVLTFIDDMEMHFSQDPRIDITSIRVEGDELLTYIPSMDGAKTPDGVLYKKVLMIEGGNLKLKEGILRKVEDDAIKLVLSR